MTTQNRSFCRTLALGSALILSQSASAVTVEVDPAGAIPGTHALVYSAEWNTDGVLEGWAANGQFTLDAGTPLSGQISGTSNNTDPNVNISGLSIPTGFDTIIEIALTKEVADTSRVDLFWGDTSGGIAAARRLSSTEPWESSPDGQPHVIRFTYAGELNGPINQFRYDMTTQSGVASSLDYIRVYTVPTPDPLEWDPTISGGASLGGTGTWDTGVTANFWDGSAQAVWPAVSSGLDEARFTGTPGTVTVDAGGVVVSRLVSNAGYQFNGGTITLDGNNAALNATQTVFNAPLASTSTQLVRLQGDSNVFAAPSTMTASLSLETTRTQFLADGTLGTGTLTTKVGNIFIAAVDGDRTLNNDVVYNGNRLIINNGTFNGFPSTSIGNLIIDGDFENAPLATPGDIYLRRNLTINGVVSGPGISGNGLRFAGDAGVMRLNNPANTFGGTGSQIRFENNTILEIVADGSLGDPANSILHAGGAGGIRLLGSFDLSRNITINGSTVGVIDTNGFDSTLNGTVTGQFGVNSRLYKNGAGRLILGAGTHQLGGGLRVQGGTLELPTGCIVNNNNAPVWDGNHGVYGGAAFEMTGGSYTCGYFAVGQGADGATMVMEDGTFTSGLELLGGFRADGTITINGGLMNLNQYRMGSATTDSTFNMNGGTVSLNFFNNELAGGVQTLNFNGATVQCKTNRTTANGSGQGLIEQGQNPVCNVQLGGAIFDTNGFDADINEPLIHDPSLGATPDGGLTKLGDGNLLLTATNTWTGDTQVSGGCLNLGNIDAIPDLAKVSVAAAAGFGGIVGPSNLLDADIQAIVDTVTWDAGGASFLVIDTNGSDVTVAANLTGNFGLIKKGEGVLTLTGNNAFTGTTVIEAGSIVTVDPVITIDSIVTSAGTNSGTKATISFTAAGNVDIYASDNLTTWSSIATDVASSPFVEDDIAAPRRFYVVVTAGETFPPTP